MGLFPMWARPGPGCTSAFVPQMVQPTVLPAQNGGPRTRGRHRPKGPLPPVQIDSDGTFGAPTTRAVGRSF